MTWQLLKYRSAILGLSVSFSTDLFAQDARQIMTHDAAVKWRSVGKPRLTPDGRWLTYIIRGPGVDTLVVRETGGKAERRYGSAGEVEISVDGTYLLFRATASPSLASVSEDSVTRASLPAFQIMHVATGALTTLPGAASAKFASHSERYVFYAVKNGTRSNLAPEKNATVVSATALFILDLTNREETRIDDVISFAVDDRARWLAYVSHPTASDRAGVYLRDLKTGRTVPILLGQGTYTSLTFDRAGEQLAFLAARGANRAENRFGLYYATLRKPTAVQLVEPDAFAGDSTIASGLGMEPLTFAGNGSVLRFHVVRSQPSLPPPPTSSEDANVQVWHFRMPTVPPRQEHGGALAAAYDLVRRKLVRVGEKSRELNSTGLLSPSGSYSLRQDFKHYAMASSWGDARSDLYVLELATGKETKLTVLDTRFPLPRFSPAGKYVYWWEAGHWHTYELGTGKRTNVTARAPGVRFDDISYDSPGPTPPWDHMDVPGWAPADERVFISDEFDIWALDPKGDAAPRAVTASLGRRERLRLRILPVQNATESDRVFDLAAPMWLLATDTRTLSEGFYRVRPDGDVPPTRVAMEDVKFGGFNSSWLVLPPLVKARDAEIYLTAKQTATRFPDLWIGPTPATLSRVTDVNSQQRNYRWLTAELIHWYSSDRVPLKGILLKPDDFDPSRQYPLIVTYYQKRSHGFHGYRGPEAWQSYWEMDLLTYTAHGYLVFIPDIVYTVGEAGASVLKSVLPGVHALLQRGFVKPDGIGCTGISWGGYETFQLVAHTRLFAGCFADAGLTDFLRGYTSLGPDNAEWRAWVYEFSQARMGGSPWEGRRDLWIENSPIFFLDRITTPLLIGANDKDDAAPFDQGMAAFLGLRRLGKEAYLLNYPGEGHGVSKPANMQDLDRRVFEFFEAKLKGKPAPAWMVGAQYTTPDSAQ